MHFVPDTLVDLLQWRELNQPNRLAYTFLKDGETEEVNLSYGELGRQARIIGARLQSLRAYDERVLLLYPPGLDYIAAFWGCLYAGAIAVPAYPPRHNRYLLRLQAILEDAQVKLVLTTSSILSKIKTTLAQVQKLKNLQWLNTDNIDKTIAEEWRDPIVTSKTLAFIQYTSGSTASPKGVMVTHANILHNQRAIQRACEHTEQSIFVSWLPIYHDMGLIGNVIQPLFIGAPCIFMSPAAFLQTPFRWLQAISRYKAHTSGGPNFAYALCVQKISPKQREMLDLSSWRVAFNGSEPIHPETIDQFAHAFKACGFRREAFFTCYGLAESTLIVSGYGKVSSPVVQNFQKSALSQNQVIESFGEEDVVPLVSSGQVWFDQKILIVDPHSRTKCPPDRIGEIWLSSPSVAQGYWNRFKETENTFRSYLADTGEGPFLRTGDLGFLKDGELFVTGRLKDLIIIRGRNYYPQDIELTIEKSHQALRPGCGAAFSVDVKDEERLVVVHEVDVRQYLDWDEIIKVIRENVAKDHELQVYAVVLIKPGSIPKTSSGKIQRQACRLEFLNESLDVVEASILNDDNASGNEDNCICETILALALNERRPLLESYLQEQVAQVLKVNSSQVDRQQPLSYFGLDSMGSVELQHRIRTNLGVLIPMEELLQDCTITHLAEKILSQLITPTPSCWPPLQSIVRDGVLPLSSAQEMFWLFDQLEPRRSIFNVPVALRLLGTLNVVAMEQSLEEIFRRHEILRTTFAMVNGQPRQIISSTPHFSLHEIEIRELPESEREIKALQQLVEEARTPFDLYRGPLLRATLLQLNKEDHVLLLTMHHIITDGWSVSVILRELSVLYNAFCTGSRSPLSDLTIQYADFAYWQRQWLQGREAESQRSYWKQKLNDAPFALELPTDYPRPAFQSYNGSRQNLVLPVTLAESLKVLSGREGCTLFMTLLTAFVILLHRYSGQDDIVVISPIANRDRAELKDIIGCVRNFLILRVDLSGNPDFQTLLRRVRQVCLEAYAHRELPFVELTRALYIKRDRIKLPLFPVMFAFQNFPLEIPNFFGLTATPMGVFPGLCDRDINFYVEARPEGLTTSLEFDTTLFNTHRVHEMLHGFKGLLESIVANPKQCLSELVTALLQESSPLSVNTELSVVMT